MDAVTGAFGYSGRHIARRLLEQGREVLTLTGSPHRSSELARRVQVRPFRFDDPGELAHSLEGVEVLYNTYWVRFNHGRHRIADAVSNSLRLFEAARRAGVRRIVHVSITNPSADSPFEYFRGKARLESALGEAGPSHAILRPAVLFGEEDILINNIAWALRRLPVFGVFGDGEYRLQPIHVEDLAELAVGLGASGEDVVVDAVGPETWSYRALVRMLGERIGAPRPIIPVPPWLGYAVATLLGWWVRDVLLTREEIGGLMAGLLCVDGPPTGKVRLSDWVGEEAHRLGRRYANELGRRRDRLSAYRA